MSSEGAGMGSSGGVEDQIAAARRGSREAFGDVIEGCREYLLLVARRGLARDVRAKEGASDLVQETFIEAQRNFAQFTGHRETELRAWLRRILAGRLAHCARRYRGTRKRALAREVSLDDASTRPMQAESLAVETPSPCSRVIRNEQLHAIERAIDRLPERQRQAVLWRHRDGCTFDEIGRRLRCSNVAARNLWMKGIRCLREHLIEVREATVTDEGSR